MTVANSNNTLYSNIRASVQDSGSDSRVEVNQRALIDKILARYASAGAVYRELLQNSNDAEATNAEVHFTTTAAADKGSSSSTSTISTSTPIVEQVMYRNNGMPFRDQDWARLKKIAEGNPDVSKVGAFGVGAYTMFSICEEPLVISGDQALAFLWRGDALWTKTATNVRNKEELGPGGRPWTTFVLPSRDPYTLPDLEEFGSFLCASLTFTRCLRNIRVFVDGNERLFIQKTQIKEPAPIVPPSSSSWFKNDGAQTSTTQGVFYLQDNKNAIKESIYQIDVLLDGDASSIQARYVSAVAKTRITSTMAKRMERVTKKQPPKEVNVEIFLNAGDDADAGGKSSKKKNKADKITESFQPQMGKGRIFIGFRTSQTTGLAAHLSAPFVPTVEREAIDLQDSTLCIFNSELLEFSGILMRLSLEHAMSLVDAEWKENAPAREKLEQDLLAQQKNAAFISAAEAAAAAEEEASQAEVKSVASEDTSVSNGIFGFAKFMAKGLKKQIVSVVSTVDKIFDDGSEYLNPRDTRPLCKEERHAILLMQSFCPQQSTPDAVVGMNLAEGFSRCMPATAPPVLAKSGVIRGDEARLPNQGMESFVESRVIRKVVYINCQEYFDVIARSRKLELKDVAQAVADEVLDQSKLIFFLNWWARYSQIDLYTTRNYAGTIKDSIAFYDEASKESSEAKSIMYLRDFLFYVEKEGLLSDPTLPMPSSVMPKSLQDAIGMRTLTDNAFQEWFKPVPLEIWLDFISFHSCITAGQAEDEMLRMKVLTIFSKEYDRRVGNERDVYGGFCRQLLSDKRCIPFDSNEPTQFAADIPSNLYLYSAELKAFDGVGSFHKASKTLKNAGITEDFLLVLGVRKSIAIEFLFQNLDTLKWSKDPKPLVEYLRSASLSSKDVNMLRRTQYLPAANDESRTFAPSELFLPDPDLRLFPFVRLLQWPSEDGLSINSENGKFLAALGCHIRPSLESVLQFTHQVQDDESRIKCLDYMSKRMGPHGPYRIEYSRLSHSQRSKFKILPATRLRFLQLDSEKTEMCSPSQCFTDISSGIMSYPVVDPNLQSRELYGTIFECRRSPDPDELLEQLLTLVQLAKKMTVSVTGATKGELSQRVMKTFALIFQYLSSKTSDFEKNSLASLRRTSFIPLLNDDGVVDWFRPEQVFFKTSESSDSLTELLFKAIEFSSFLSAVGVKEEASAKDLFLLIVQEPEAILEKLGKKKYVLLLRRLAANPPFSRVSPQIRNAPFLLAYTHMSDDDDAKDKQNFKLAKAEDIYVIDNSFFGRMFPVLRAPHESDLEDFYSLIGSKFISKEVQKRYEIVGSAQDATSLTRALRERIDERTPLLVSPHVTSRDLVPNAALVLDTERLTIFEADGLLAVFTLGKSERRQRTTCCARHLDRKRNAMYVTKDLDFFDVGQSIGDLILQRCQLEDAFFISSLLDTSLEQLRSRGFPVDRVLKPKPPPEEPQPKQPPKKAPEVQATSKAADTGSDVTGVAAAASVASAAATNNKGPQSPDDADTVNTAASSTAGEDGDVFSSEEIWTMVKQMFPDADVDFLRKQLGTTPSLAEVQKLAEVMATGDYPRKSETQPDKSEPHAVKPAASAALEAPHESQSSKKPLKKKSLKKSLGRALGGFRGGDRGGSSSASAAASGGDVRAGGVGSQMGPAIEHIRETDPVAPQHDAASYSNMTNMLQNEARNSAPVNAKGIKSNDTLLTSVPKDLDRGNTCEVVPGQSLKPYAGPRGDGRTHNGIQVFSARRSPDSETFLLQHDDAVEKFALVLVRLAEVYEIDSGSIAIFHDPFGGTIAFNSNRSLHFNVRFFHALHYLQNKHDSFDCYSYWMVVFAHELSHNLVSAHNKEHGFYTESYIAHYLPRFFALMGSLPRDF